MDQKKLAAVLRNAERLYAQAESNGEKRHARIILHAFDQLANHQNPAFMKALQKMKRVPVTIDEFIDSPDFLGGDSESPLMEIWPTLRADLRKMNPDQLAGETPITEIILGGATGTGKTATATVTNAYQLYTLLCFDWSQELFGLSRSTPIIFMFAAVSSIITNRVLYKPFRDLFTSMKFIDKYVEYNKQLESSLVIGQNIMVVPALATVQAMVGQAVMSGILDEVNFMARIENSKQVPGSNGAGGTFDQAELAYTNLSRRRKSRFTTRGISPGAICVVSSTRYKGDFLDRRMAELDVHPEKGTLVFRNKQYEIVPQERFAGPRFRLLVGTDRWPTRILEENEQAGRNYPAEAVIESIPVEYRDEFVKDPEAALRDIVGVATDAITPFIAQRDKIVECVKLGTAARLKPVLNRDEVVLQRESLPVLPDRFTPQDPEAPRFIHIDLATTHDRCGVAMVRHDGYDVVRGERLPRLSVELALGIKPDTLNQLQISELREWIVRLIDKYKLNVVQISYDGFNSKESIQILKRAGFRSALVSVDRTPEPYLLFREMIYDGRIHMFENELLRQELSQLEWFEHKNKVDHPPRGGKDVADAVCGAAYAATKHPMVRSGIRALNSAGEEVRSVFSYQRPSTQNRPSGSRPRSAKDKLRDHTLPTVSLPEGGLDDGLDGFSFGGDDTD